MLHNLKQLNSQNLSKEEKYATATQSIRAVCHGESSMIANLANTSAILKEIFNWHWIGFYIVADNELVLGPFQGPVACTRIAYDRGVCGTSWKTQNTIVVGNVHEFPGHIACSSLSNSEIVVPIINNDAVLAVLDADSVNFNDFDDTDKLNLEKICSYLAKYFRT